jgi:hypothetical protein
VLIPIGSFLSRPKVVIIYHNLSGKMKKNVYASLGMGTPFASPRAGANHRTGRWLGAAEACSLVGSRVSISSFFAE